MWHLLQVITQFLKLETILDDSVNTNIELQIERGGTSKSLTLLVRFVLLDIYFISTFWHTQVFIFSMGGAPGWSTCNLHSFWREGLKKSQLYKMINQLKASPRMYFVHPSNFIKTAWESLKIQLVVDYYNTFQLSTILFKIAEVAGISVTFVIL